MLRRISSKIDCNGLKMCFTNLKYRKKIKKIQKRNTSLDPNTKNFIKYSKM